MADPWQECMDYAVDLARKAGEVSIKSLKIITLFIKSSLYIAFEGAWCGMFLQGVFCQKHEHH